MINKKLLSFDRGALRYVGANVAFQWLGMLCNVIFVRAIARLVGAAFAGMLTTGVLWQNLLLCLGTVPFRFVFTLLASGMSDQASKNVKRTLRSSITDNYPLAGVLIPEWNMGSYISQTQLASLLGVELSAVEMQDMTNLTLGLGALQKVTPAGALDGYTYYQLPAGETGLTCIVGLPLKELFSGTTPLHILLTIPEHEVRISLSGTVTAAETAVVAPTSRMSDADVDNFVQLRQALEKFAEVLQKAAS